VSFRNFSLYRSWVSNIFGIELNVFHIPVLVLPLIDGFRLCLFLYANNSLSGIHMSSFTDHKFDETIDSIYTLIVSFHFVMHMCSD
jgi:hypothetical protein